MCQSGKHIASEFRMKKILSTSVILIEMLLQVILGLILTLLALIGFLFNFYIVLALVLTKQVQVPNLFKSLFATDLEAKQPPAAAPRSQQQHLDHPLPLHLLALHLHRIPCCWHHCLSGGHCNGLNQKIKNNYSSLFNLCRCMVSSCT